VLNSLSNPKTENYLEFKRWVLSPYCLWSYVSSATRDYNAPVDIEGEQKSLPYYTRTIKQRPENTGKDPGMNSSIQEVNIITHVLDEILVFNDIKISDYARISINCNHPEKKIYNNLPHIDHQFPHGNVIVYLTDSGGKTFVKNEDTSLYEEHDPVEDDIILFSGKHFMQSPSDNRRIVLVATILPQVLE
tara:strand:- start:414 stop:983 length:570 start_codon:yes stop_codon:yes gene_type:complete